MNKYDIAIIGAGPSGIMSAITAAQSGKSVILIEKNQIVGRKILATGNGRCNLTNKNANATRYHGANSEFISHILSQFDQFAVMKYFESLGVVLKEEDNGRVFPRTNQATSVLEALTHELQRLKVTVKTDTTVKSIERNNGLQVILENGSKIISDKLILTTGGRAAHQFGSSGDGLFWVTKLGHELTTIHAALVPLEIVETWVKDIQGLKIEGEAKVVVEDKVLAQKSGDILFTHFGLSGPTIMGLARTVAPHLDKTKVEIHIDIIPEQSLDELNLNVDQIFAQNGAKQIKNALAGLIPFNLVATILNNLSIDKDKKAAEISKKDRLAIIKTIKDLVLTVSKCRQFKEAQVTAGGIKTSEIDPKTLQSKIVPNLFFAGEILDVDGDSGGFNLQWAWSSGHLAGKRATI